MKDEEVKGLRCYLEDISQVSYILVKNRSSPFLRRRHCIGIESAQKSTG